MKTPDEIVTRVVLANLPPEVDQRRRVLNALAQRLDPESSQWGQVSDLLSALDSHIGQLRELGFPADKTGKASR